MPVGASGTVSTVTEADPEEAPVPALLMAATVNETGPPDMAEKTHEVVAELQVRPLLAVTRYDEISSPPELAGAVQETVTSAPFTIAAGEVGAPGTAAGIRAPEAVDEATPVPARLVAVTVNV
jgi:hypothetical protein